MDDARPDDGAGADFSGLADHGAGRNQRAGADMGARADFSAGMNRFGPLRPAHAHKRTNRLSEGGARAGAHNDRCCTVDGVSDLVGRDQYNSAVDPEPALTRRLGDETELAGAGAFRLTRVNNGDGGVAPDDAADPLGQRLNA